MGNIRRGTIANDFLNSLKLDVAGGDKAPNETSDKIVLTYDYTNTKYANIVKFDSSTTTADLTLYTTPTDRDFYLTFAQISIVKNATDDGTNTNLNVTIGGASVTLMSIRGLTTTAQDQSLVSNFTVPIKLDRNSAIRVAHATTAGSIAKYGSIAGFIVDG